MLCCASLQRLNLLPRRQHATKFKRSRWRGKALPQISFAPAAISASLLESPHFFQGSKTIGFFTNTHRERYESRRSNQRVLSSSAYQLVGCGSILKRSSPPSSTLNVQQQSIDIRLSEPTPNENVDSKHPLLCQGVAGLYPIRLPSRTS